MGSIGLNCAQYSEIGHALHLYMAFVNDSLDFFTITLTRSFSLYLVMSPDAHSTGHPISPVGDVGTAVGDMVPEHCPIICHACLQCSDLDPRRSGLNAA